MNQKTLGTSPLQLFRFSFLGQGFFLESFVSDFDQAISLFSERYLQADARERRE